MNGLKLLPTINATNRELNNQINVCRSLNSDVCPEIPKELSDEGVMAFLKQGIAKINYKPQPDMVNHPPHYNNHPSGVEAITITEHMSFNIGNAVKYLWRVDEKLDTMEDIDKAIWYLNREKLKRTKEKEKNG